MKEITLTIEETGRKAVKLVMPIAAVMILLFLLLHGYKPFLNGSWAGTGIFLGSALAGIVLHELLHALVLGVFVTGGYRSIKFGLDKNTFTPYCHCTKPLRAQWYRAGALTPLFIQGILPFIISLFTGSIGWWAYGLLFTIGAGGDMLAVKMLRGIPPRALVQDHPRKMGFYLIDSGSTG